MTPRPGNPAVADFPRPLASAPSPLYAVYAQRWQFSAWLSDRP
jgi:hypothetical protein